MTLPREATPIEISAKVRGFCESIACEEQPMFVAVQPTDGSVPGDSLGNVARLVAQFGGGSMLGWSITERSRIDLRAELYAIWKTSTGELVDVTPRSDGAKQTLFLPDARQTADGRGASVRVQPWAHWREIQDFLAAEDRLKKLRPIDPETEDASQHVRVQAEWKRAVQALEKRLVRAT